MPRLDELLATHALHTPARIFLRGGKDWTYEQAEDEVTRRAIRCRERNVASPVAICEPNSPAMVLNVLAVMRAGLASVLIPCELTEEEAQSLMCVAGATYRIETDALKPTGIAASPLPTWLQQEMAIAFATSGSTGAPRLALRSHASLLAEGRRYQALWHANSEDVVLAPAPLYHSYSFGAALAGALTAGVTLVPVVFKSAHGVSTQIQSYRATIVPLVPAMARTLALVDQGQPCASDLRIVMVGAGQTSNDLSTLFAQRWNIGLARNYGSSETGAVLASLPCGHEEATGDPMAGVECNLVEHHGQAGAQLWVRLEEPPLGYLEAHGYEAPQLAPGGWWPMGDLFEKTISGSLRFICRKGSVIRRGGHSIQPQEIEAALLSLPAVAEAYVRGGLDRHGEEHVEAHVALKEPASASVEELYQSVRTRLAAYKIPNKWHFYEQLPKTWSLKINARKLSSEEMLPPHSPFQAMQGFRESHAIFAAEEIGLLEELQRAFQPAATLAEKLACDPQALEIFLEYLGSTGLVQRSPAGYKLKGSLEAGWKDLFVFEDTLRTTWLAPEQIVAVLRNGLTRRAFEEQEKTSTFSTNYAAAFCGAWQELGARMLQRKLKLLPGSQVLEIGRAAGRITAYLRETLRMEARFCALAPAPAIAWRELQEVESTIPYAWAQIPLPPASLDAVVLTNAIHWLDPKEAIEIADRILHALRPGGAVAIVDIFVDPRPQTTNFLLDWLTHGGVHWTRLQPLKDWLVRSGFSELDSGCLPGTSVHWITSRRPLPVPQLTTYSMEKNPL